MVILPNSPPPSALQTFLSTHPPTPSTSTSTVHTTSQHNLALQIAHNLQHQHLWTSIHLHTSPQLPRPLLSGIPPQRLYIHPDEQIALLQQQKDSSNGSKTGMPQVAPQREWVLPSHLREKWSLRRFGEVFDAIGKVPSQEAEGEDLFPTTTTTTTAERQQQEKTIDEEGGSESQWRLDMPKRVLLATLDDDSTVVYYIVHDGIVKPRQN